LILEKREKKKEARNLYIQRCAGFFVRYNKIAYFSRGCSLNRAQIRDILFNGFH
jgi:ribosomal protein L20